MSASLADCSKLGKSYAVMCLMEGFLLVIVMT